jgi:ElaB/YqjD/DUF883 family membrane-anchored ribosome-binding protein
MTALSEQLEREAEQNRARLAETLDELRARVTPGQVLDQLIEYAGNGTGGEIVRNLGQQVRRNPLSVAMVGAGVAWLMMSSRPSDRTPTPPPVDDAERKAAARLAALSDRTTAPSSGGEEATSVYRRGAEAAADAAQRARDNADSAYQTASHAVSEAAHKASHTAAAIGRNTASATRTLADLCHDQPLVLAGLGLALGAALGTSLPPTETERRLMGASSDTVKRRARRLAAQIDPHTTAADADAAMRRDERTKAKTPSGEDNESTVVRNPA